MRCVRAVEWLGALGGLVCGFASAQVERISLDASGGEANGASVEPAISQDGRYVAFSSTATDLIASDANGAVRDVFVRDRSAGTTALVSISDTGQQSAYASRAPSISADGRYVAFLGNALSASDPWNFVDVYRRDRASGTTVLVSAPSFTVSYLTCQISGDGRLVAYFGRDPLTFDTLVAVKELQSGQTWTWVSSPTSGPSTDFYSNIVLARDGGYVAFSHFQYDAQNVATVTIDRFDLAGSATLALLPNQASSPRAISADGRFVLYGSYPSSPNALYSLDVATSAVHLVTQTTNGAQPDASISDVAVSDDGRRVLFSSAASNLVTGDANGRSDVFLHDSAINTTVLVSVGAGGQGGNGDSFGCDLVGNASLMVFDSQASDLIAGDLNGVADVFVSAGCGAGLAYCTTSTTTNGCSPQIGASGTASASATSGFTITVTQVEGVKNGMVFYGLAPQALPFGASWLCIAAPKQRTTAALSGGTLNACNGVLSIDLLAWIAAHPGALATPLQAGQTLYLQGWFRDPPAPKHANLSGGWSVTMCP